MKRLVLRYIRGADPDQYIRELVLPAGAIIDTTGLTSRQPEPVAVSELVGVLLVDDAPHPGPQPAASSTQTNPTERSPRDGADS
jgi:hypothetical protein